MSINNGLDLKTKFVREKKKRITSEISSTLVQYSLKCWVAFFSRGIIFKVPSLMLFNKVFVKELAHILTYVHKIFNRRVFFKMLLSMCLVIAEKKL